MSNIRKIGNITFDYTFFTGNDCYSDGDIEDILLDAAKSEKLNELLYSNSDWAILYHCSNIRENLLEWFPFSRDASLLEVGSGCGALTGLLASKVKKVTCIELSERRSLINAYRNSRFDNIEILLGNFQDIEITEKYDYITLIGVWEYAGYYIKSNNPYVDMLRKLKGYLKKGGKIIIAIENKMGLKYWNGAREDHVGNMYSGLNDYIENEKVRTFSKKEIEKILEFVGFDKYKFYYPNPDYKLPNTIFTDDRLPFPGEIRNYRSDYDNPRVYNFNDAVVADQICEDGMFAYFSNSFIIECGENLSDIIYAKYDRIRKDKFEISTIMKRNSSGVVVFKNAMSDKSKNHVANIIKNEEVGLLNIAKGAFVDGYYQIPMIEGKTIMYELYGFRHDLNEFIENTKKYIKKLFAENIDNKICFAISDEYISIFGENYIENAECLKISNVDLTFSNIIIQNDELICIDNEWVFNFPIPLEYIKWRAINNVYLTYYPYLKSIITKKDFFDSLGINVKNVKCYEKMEEKFSSYVCKEDYRKRYIKPAIFNSISIR